MWTKVLLSLLSPWRASGYFMNTPEMIEGGAGRPYDPTLPMGRVGVDAQGFLVAGSETYADD